MARGLVQGTHSLFSNTIFAFSNAATRMSKVARKVFLKSWPLWENWNRQLRVWKKKFSLKHEKWLRRMLLYLLVGARWIQYMEAFGGMRYYGLGMWNSFGLLDWLSYNLLLVTKGLITASFRLLQLLLLIRSMLIEWSAGNIYMGRKTWVLSMNFWRCVFHAKCLWCD